VPEWHSAADLSALLNIRSAAWLAFAALWILGVTSCERPYQVSTGERLVSATDPAIRYSGRWDRTDAAHPKASWPGFSLSTNFSGTTLSVLMRDEGNYYNVWIDGQQSSVIGGAGTGRASLTLASGLAPGFHHVLMRRRNISFEKPTEIDGFVVDNGASLAPPQEKNGPRMEFIGDSFTAAEGNEAKEQTLEWVKKYPVTNFDLGFAGDIARAYDAEFTAICRSGSGLVCDWKGNRRNTMLDRYERTLMEETTPKWAFTEDPPELVVICLGLNDFTGLKGADGEVSAADTDAFREAYHRLIERVRSHAPRAKIVAVAAFTPWLRENVGKIVKEERDSGQGDVHYAQFDRFPDGYVADGHPTVDTHRKMAEQVISQLVEMKLLPPPSGLLRPERNAGFEGKQRSLEEPPAQPSQKER
jgi:hypothetical protein